MLKTGFRPQAMLEVMDILHESSRGGAPVEFLSTHPPHGKRKERIERAIVKYGG
jgi:predicted Zn-dependent protease